MGTKSLLKGEEKMNFKPYYVPFLLFALVAIGIETLGVIRGLYEYPISIIHIGIVPFAIVVYWSAIGLLSFLAYRKWGWKVGLFIGLIIDIPAEAVAYYSGAWVWNNVRPFWLTIFDAPLVNFFTYINMSLYAILIYRYFVK